MTDKCTADLRARLTEELKNSLKVRSFHRLPGRSGLKAVHQARDSLASTTIRVCTTSAGFQLVD